MAFEFVPLWTLADAVEYLIDSANATGITEERRKARRAVLDAYREFPGRDEWAYFNRTGQVRTQAGQSDGTCAYDHTGGAEERLVTLTDTTVPTAGEWFTFKVAGVEYPVETVISSTTFTLPEFSNPGADIASGTSYELFRAIYPVPLDWRVGSEIVSLSDWLSPTYCSPNELLEAKRFNGSPQGWQQFYTVRGGPQHYGGLVFEFQPPPNSARTFTFNYQADPRPIGLIGTATEYSAGTVAVSGTTVTGTSTAWTTRMIGSIIRFTASTTALPTGTGGAYQNDNPYTEQRVIADVTSAMSLTIDAELTGTYSGVKHTIGDPLDLDYHVMLDAFLAMCAWKFAQVISKDTDFVKEKEAAWKRAFAGARAADYRVPERTESVPTPIYARLIP
jgi:hypothetical protein